MILLARRIIPTVQAVVKTTVLLAIVTVLLAASVILKEKFTLKKAVVCNLPVAVAEVAAGESVSIDARAVVALLYMGIFCTGAAHLLWNESLSMVEAGICSAFYPVQPLVSVILGILFLHENITTSFVIGCVVIVIGVLVCILKKKD